MKTIIELLKKTINAKDPSLDLSASSTLADLLITPGSIMLEPFIRQLQFLLNNLGLRYPYNIDPSELDAIAGNFLKVRNPGTKSTGTVELYYITPTNVEIPAGTEFTDINGNIYINLVPYYISADNMLSNTWNYPFYSSGPVAVESVAVGLTTEIGPNEIVSTSLTPAPDQLTNPAGFTGGTDAETNDEFVQRLLDEVITGSLGSAQGIQNSIMSSFPTIQTIEIRGMGDTEMLRDLVASGVNVYPYHKIVDYYGKVSGLNDLPYPESLAYWSVYWDNPLTSGLQPDLPSLEEYVDEINTDQYAGMYALDDASYMKLNTLVIAEERFSDLTLPAHWRKSDAKLGLASVVSPFEIEPETRGGSDKLRLGYRVTNAVVPSRAIKVDAQFLYNVLNALKTVSTFPPNTAAHIPYVYTQDDVDNIAL